MTRSDGRLGRCRICSGELVLARAGSGSQVAPSGFVPTCHSPGDHGDLYRCHECGTVEQPFLPQGDALLDVYREMSDDDYLAEETGRRQTAARLVDLVAHHVPRGRLLEVGCGHGFLLDEARRHGYEVEGLELSRAAALHCRETLGLPVRQVPVHDASLDEEIGRA